MSEEDTKFISIIEKVPEDLRTWDMNALLEARKLDALMIEYYQSKPPSTNAATPELTIENIAQELCKDDNSGDQRLLNFCRIALLGTEPSIPMKPDFLIECYPFFTATAIPNGVGTQISVRMFFDELKKIPFTTRLILKAILASVIFASQQKETEALMEAVSLLNIAAKALKKDPEAHNKTLGEYDPTLTASQLLFVIGKYQDRIYINMDRSNPAINRTATLGMEAAGKLMIESLPNRPEGYFAAGLAKFEQLDVKAACAEWRKGLKIADDLGHQYYSCILRYEVAWAVLSGGEGPSFEYLTLHTLLEKARSLAEQLKYYKVSEKNQLIQVQQHVEQSVAFAIPANTSLTDRLSAAPLAMAPQDKLDEIREKIETKLSCSYCGKKLETLRRCSACKTANYCSKECQQKAWPDHKAECKRLQKAREEEERSSQAS